MILQINEKARATRYQLKNRGSLNCFFIDNATLVTESETLTPLNISQREKTPSGTEKR